MFQKEKKTGVTIIPYIISLVLITLWLLLIMIGPLLYKLGSEYTVFADMYYYIFHFSCHQKPERSYWLFNYQLPVCVRCFGIYFGIFLALVIYPLFNNIKSMNLPQKRWLLLGFLPIIIDGLSQVFHLYPSPHWLRFLTGIFCGGVAIFYVIPGFNEAASLILEEKDLYFSKKTDNKED